MVVLTNSRVRIAHSQCVKRSHIFGVALRSRSRPKKRSATPTSLLQKKRSGTLLSLFSKKPKLSKKLQTLEFFLTPLIIRDFIKWKGQKFLQSFARYFIRKKEGFLIANYRVTYKQVSKQQAVFTTHDIDRKVKETCLLPILPKHF